MYRVVSIYKFTFPAMETFWPRRELAETDRETWANKMKILREILKERKILNKILSKAMRNILKIITNNKSGQEKKYLNVHITSWEKGVITRPSYCLLQSVWKNWHYDKDLETKFALLMWFKNKSKAGMSIHVNYVTVCKARPGKQNSCLLIFFFFSALSKYIHQFLFSRVKKKAAIQDFRERQWFHVKLQAWTLFFYHLKELEYWLKKY